MFSKVLANILMIPLTLMTSKANLLLILIKCSLALQKS